MRSIHKATLALFSVSLLSSSASAFTLNLGLDAIRASDNSFITQSALALIVVDKDGSGGFDLPTAGASTNVGPFGSDYIAWRGDFSGAGADGVFFDSPNFEIGTVDVPFNSRFSLFWFPDLTIGDMAFIEGTSYGYYSTLDATQFASDSAWNVGGSNSATYNINVFSLNNTGNLTSNPEPTGLSDATLQATFVVVPEPSSMVLLAVGLFAALQWQRGRNRG